jgi:hypothetical protein
MQAIYTNYSQAWQVCLLGLQRITPLTLWHWQISTCSEHAVHYMHLFQMNDL